MAQTKTSKGKAVSVKTTKSKVVSGKGAAVSVKAGKPRIYTKKLGTKIAASAKPANTRKYHVIVGNSEKWTVVADGNVRATKVFETKEGAIEFARTYAIKINGEIIIHKESGEIEDRVSLAE